MDFANINGVPFTKEQFCNMLADLVEQAMDTAPTRGDYSEIGLTYHFLDDKHLL